jgi:hypothetical protein
MRLKQRLIEMPPALDIVDFLQFDGKPPADVHYQSNPRVARRRQRLL